MNDEYKRKVLGLMHLSTVPLQFTRIKGAVQIHENERLLIQLGIDRFNELTAHEILEQIGVEAHAEQHI